VDTGTFETELAVVADEKLAEGPCEETAGVVRSRPCLAPGAEVLATDEREPDVGPTLAAPTRDCAFRLPLPSPLPLISSETPVISSTGTCFKVLAEVVDMRRDRLRSRVTSRSSDRFPSDVN